MAVVAICSTCTILNSWLDDDTERASSCGQPNNKSGLTYKQNDIFDIVITV
jgi:hypothetical protein